MPHLRAEEEEKKKKKKKKKTEKTTTNALLQVSDVSGAALTETLCSGNCVCT
jgi:hypothetical protein